MRLLWKAGEVRMRLIDATVKYLREFRCKDCDRRKGMRNRFIYEIGDALCRACDIGDTIDYFLDEDISPIIDAVLVVRCKDCENWIPGYITDQDDFIPPKCGKYQQMVGHSADDFCSLAEKQEGR